ncbi:uncharacterized protein RCO7_09966 [Rhynchosporium graminicola]|uniref:Uncharacterized protein n=1 Tax=Rhynchosporium graminicola TaxID=2792576 RepID=A0A1E1LLB0_9HELO|nr:uncharacterized protein RCO7_09966 [Rhynchosporium commune]
MDQQYPSCEKYRMYLTPCAKPKRGRFNTRGGAARVLGFSVTRMMWDDKMLLVQPLNALSNESEILPDHVDTQSLMMIVLPPLPIVRMANMDNLGLGPSFGFP